MSDAFKLKKEFRAAYVGDEEVDGDIRETGREHIADGFHVLRTAYIDADQIKTETGAVL